MEVIPMNNPINVISFKNKTIPVISKSNRNASLEQLSNKLRELELDFEFRKKWKKISSIEMVGEVAVFKYYDGTKLYLEVS